MQEVRSDCPGGLRFRWCLAFCSATGVLTVRLRAGLDSIGIQLEVVCVTSSVASIVPSVVAAVSCLSRSGIGCGGGSSISSSSSSSSHLAGALLTLLAFLALAESLETSAEAVSSSGSSGLTSESNAQNEGGEKSLVLHRE